MQTPPVSVDAADAFTARTGTLARVQHLLHRYPVISPAAVLVIACIVFSLKNSNFSASLNIGIMLQQTAVLATLAVGQTLIVLTAGVDLSVGTAMLLVHLIIAKLTIGKGMPFIDGSLPGVVALGIGLMVALALGAFHGGLVTRVGLPPFIVTLGTFYIFQSLGLVYSDAQTLPGDAMSGLLTWTGTTFKVAGIQITYGVLVAVVVYLVFAYVLANTAWGQHVYATGDDKEAARLAGIDVNRVLVSVYMVAGLVYAIGAWVQIGRANSASANAATDINLESITAVVIGGTSLFGGRGRLWGTLVGALIVTVFRQGLKLAEVNVYWQTFAIGTLILVAVALDQWIRKVGK
jgi:fructose transport system permease protein